VSNEVLRELYSTRHPHYTPQWLSERLASYLPLDIDGSVIDPACGAGNLLAAAIVHLRGAGRSANDSRFYGIDTSSRAVAECRQTLRQLLPSTSYRIYRNDFLKVSRADFGPKPNLVVMNPPFRGYGGLSLSRRHQIKHNFEMRGRFNLAYAFVYHAIRLLEPSVLVSLLPSNWVYSANSVFRTELNELPGKWEWEDLPDYVFPKIAMHIGILTWRPLQRRSTNDGHHTSGSPTAAGYEVRQGVATGRDNQFMRLAEHKLPFGRKLLAVRGRDIGRSTGSLIWIPPLEKLSISQQRQLGSIFPRRIRLALAKRSSVRVGRKIYYELHETFPTWFIAQPKVLIPEIVSNKVRVEFDASGSKLPLHSVIAIRVPSKKHGRALARFLRGDRCLNILRSHAPRLVGGASRVQVGVVRRLLREWQQTNCSGASP
jgi:hypothetical protein